MTGLGRARRSSRSSTSISPAGRACAATGPSPCVTASSGRDPRVRPTPHSHLASRRWRCLLTDGLTNGQVAERLYISPKTAAVHVSNILAKLGLSSRAEIAAWTVRNSLEAPGAPKSA